MHVSLELAHQFLTVLIEGKSFCSRLFCWNVSNTHILFKILIVVRIIFVALNISIRYYGLARNKHRNIDMKLHHTHKTNIHFCDINTSLQQHWNHLFDGSFEFEELERLLGWVWSITYWSTLCRSSWVISSLRLLNFPKTTS